MGTIVERVEPIDSLTTEHTVVCLARPGVTVVLKKVLLDKQGIARAESGWLCPYTVAVGGPVATRAIVIHDRKAILAVRVGKYIVVNHPVRTPDD